MSLRTDGRDGALEPAADYRHPGATRKNTPPAGLAPRGRVADALPVQLSYDPHLPPMLRFDPTGRADRLPELVQAALERPLTLEEAEQLAAGLRQHQPWLEWAGKQEARPAPAADPVVLTLHERVATKAILAAAGRRDIQRSLFADPAQPYDQAVRFYQHDVGWSNRLILGDSLQVMLSLAAREGLAGKVQCIYIDPPYGIKFGSNFQPTVGKRDVKDADEDLTREPEQVKAYRDTWRLGVHSYLAYLRDRLIAARDLLTDSGSIFVQIGDENVHRVRAVMDEVFGERAFVSLVTFKKTSSFSSEAISNVSDYIIWYARDRDRLKFNSLFKDKDIGGEGASKYRPLSSLGAAPDALDRFGAETWARSDTLTSQGSSATPQVVQIAGRQYVSRSGSHWKTNVDGIARLDGAGRVLRDGASLSYLRLQHDFPMFPLSSVWLDIGGIQSRSDPKVYAVQTSTTALQRCILMTTDPGDLVLDPTCGSGTTAYVAEQWGRRWITIDTSRVALAIARQRILTATFPYYQLRDSEAGPAGGFIYETVPHITLKSIAQNRALDDVFARHDLVLAARLTDLNAALAAVPATLRADQARLLRQKEAQEGKRAITEADRRRWLLPDPASGWQEWEVPYDSDPAWPEPLRAALAAYRAAWRAKMDEVDGTIAAAADQEELVDKPKIVRNVPRVAGPFTVESVRPKEESLVLDGEPPVEESAIEGFDGELETFAADAAPPAAGALATLSGEAHIRQMLDLLRADGVRHLGNRQVRLLSLQEKRHAVLHADGEWAATAGGDPRRVAVVIGPRYGNLPTTVVEEAIRAGNRQGYDDLLFAAFGFDDAAQAAIDAANEEAGDGGLQVHAATIRPDVLIGAEGESLLKTTANSQLFTIQGRPRTRIEAATGPGVEAGEVVAVLEGVDIYNPVANTVEEVGATGIAAWFLDSDYDGRTFCICQAFFPDSKAWDKIRKDLKDAIDDEAFAAFSGNRSLPFRAGQHGRCAIKVIDPRGNEVMRVHALRDDAVYARDGRGE